MAEGGARSAGAVAPKASHPANVPAWWQSRRGATIASALCGVLALLLCLYQLAQPRAIKGVVEYDDGVYLGIILRFVHGAMPYRDFAVPSPPGLTVLLSPVALIGSFTGTRNLMAAARLLTALVAATNAFLAGRLLRSRGVLPAVVAGGALAAFPVAATATRTLMLEPWAVLFCLIGATAMFDGDEVAGSSRVALAGGALGFAITVKLFAAMPAAAALLCVLRTRSKARPLALGMAAGIVLPSLPFLGAPRNLARQSLILQLVRHHVSAPVSIGDRVVALTGVGGVPVLHSSTAIAYGLGAALVGLAIVAFVPGGRTALDRFILTSCALTVGAFLLAGDFFLHYAYFSAAFLALLLGTSLDRALRRALALSRHHWRRAPGTHRWPAPTALVVVSVAVLLLAQQVLHFERQLGQFSFDPGADIEAVVPSNACVVTDISSLTIASNRFVTDASDCPTIVDAFWTWQVVDRHSAPGSGGPFDPALVAAWKRWLTRADFAVFSTRLPDLVPWRPDLKAWFLANFRLVSSPSPFIYRSLNDRHRSDRPPADTSSRARSLQTR